MKKEEHIRRYGKAAYEKRLQQSAEWRAANPSKVKANNEVYHIEENRKGGKYYEQHRQHRTTGIPHEKELVRNKHGYFYRPYKQIIAPESQIHHEWLPGTADYRGVALVEKDQHMYGFVDVIQILEGEITLLTEGEIRNREGGT